MNPLFSAIESLLLASNKPISIDRLSSLLTKSKNDVESAVAELRMAYEDRAGGLRIVQEGRNFQLTTAPEHSEVVRRFLKEEQTGELTRPSLETLTIIAYRGPIRKSELELIRGVNCGLILRNLLIRGLIEEERDEKTGEPMFRISMEFLKWLGISDAKRLPDYARLSRHELLDAVLAAGSPATPDPSSTKEQKEES